MRAFSRIESTRSWVDDRPVVRLGSADDGRHDVAPREAAEARVGPVQGEAQACEWQTCLGSASPGL
eukprot:scaffold43903_cov40-Phaeocystis_antarctica.AAC.3